MGVIYYKNMARNCEGMTICLRCEKTIFPDNPVSCHTCTPRGAWRKGMDEGYLQALQDVRNIVNEVMDQYEENFDPDATYLFEHIKLEMEMLKQGKSDD